MFILYFNLEKRKSISRNGKTFSTCLCCGLQERAVTFSILGSFSERPCGFGVTGPSSCPVSLWTHSSLGPDLFNAVAFNWPTEILSPGTGGSYLLPSLAVLDLGFLSSCHLIQRVLPYCPHYLSISLLICLHGSVRGQGSSLKPGDLLSFMEMPGLSAAPCLSHLPGKMAFLQKPAPHTHLLRMTPVILL